MGLGIGLDFWGQGELFGSVLGKRGNTQKL